MVFIAPLHGNFGWQKIFGPGDANFFSGPTSDLDFGSISFCACALLASTFEPTNFDLQCSHWIATQCQREKQKDEVRMSLCVYCTSEVL